MKNNKRRMQPRNLAAFLALATCAALFAACPDGNRSFSIIFDPNGGTGTPPNNMLPTAGERVTLPGYEGLTKSEYIFAGWSSQPSGGTTLNEGASFIMPSENITMYAQWIPAGIRITVTGIPSQYFGRYGTVVLEEIRTLNEIAYADRVRINGSTVTFMLRDAKSREPFYEAGPYPYTVFLGFFEGRFQGSPLTAGYDIPRRSITAEVNTIPYAVFAPALNIIVTGIPNDGRLYAIGEFLYPATRRNHSTSNIGIRGTGESSVILHFLGARPGNYYVALWFARDSSLPWADRWVYRYEAPVHAIVAGGSIVPFYRFERTAAPEADSPEDDEQPALPRTGQRFRWH